MSQPTLLLSSSISSEAISMSFTGGKLKLKGADPLKSAGGVKKKKKKAKATDDDGTMVAVDDTGAGSSGVKGSLEGAPIPPRDDVEDRRTEAEKRRDEHMKRLEMQQIKKLAVKSHRERVKEFNEQLASLSEHYDIPKVGPG